MAWYFTVFFQSSLSPVRLQVAEQAKLDSITEMSTSLLDLNKKRASLDAEKTIQLRTKCEVVKKLRIQAYKQKASELDAKERELCRKTNQLADELVAHCDDTPFNKALIKILGNLKGYDYLSRSLSLSLCLSLCLCLSLSLSLSLSVSLYRSLSLSIAFFLFLSFSFFLTSVSEFLSFFLSLSFLLQSRSFLLSGFSGRGSRYSLSLSFFLLKIQRAVLTSKNLSDFCLESARIYLIVAQKRRIK